MLNRRQGVSKDGTHQTLHLSLAKIANNDGAEARLDGLQERHVSVCG